MRNIFWGMTFAVFLFVFSGCRQIHVDKKDNAEEDGKFEITFGVEGGHGKIYAELDGAYILSGLKVDKGKKIIFTAAPDSGYITENWINAKQDNADLNKAILTVTAKTNVKVKYKVSTVNIPNDFVIVPVPKNGIEGREADYPLSSDREQWKGVFRNGRKVKLSPYAVSRSEVTYKLWKEVYSWALKNGYSFANEGRMGGAMESAYNVLEHTEDEPVTQVNWRDCIVWCNAYTHMLNGNTNECVYFKADGSAVLKDSSNDEECDSANMNTAKKGFRLLTEAEWEYAARYRTGEGANSVRHGEVFLTKLNSISGAEKPIGFPALEPVMGSETWQALRDEADMFAVYRNWWDGSDWYPYNADGNLRQKATAKILSKRPNDLGVYDMSGNVWEWCFDKYSELKQGDFIDPVSNASSDNHRIQRGGGWMSGAISCAVGFRGENPPERKSDILGFRIAVYLK